MPTAPSKMTPTPPSKPQVRRKVSLERITVFSSAFDKRDSNPSKNYGIGAVKCYMVLKGKNTAVHFVFSTGIYLPETMQEYAREGKASPHRYSFDNSKYYFFNEPIGYDVGYHSPRRQFKGQTLGDKKCDWIGKPCYCDGSALRAEKYMDVLIREGSEKIWQMLEEEYDELNPTGTRKRR